MYMYVHVGYIYIYMLLYAQKCAISYESIKTDCTITNHQRMWGS